MSNAPISGIDSNSIARFIGRNADYYVQAWRALEIKKSMVSWNWPAFCFGPFWLAYRKMYLYTVLLFILGYGVDLILKFETVAGIVGAVAQVVLMGVFGNAIYRKHVTGEVALIEATHKEEADRAVAMGRRGGSTFLPVIILLAILLAGGAILAAMEDAGVGR